MRQLDRRTRTELAAVRRQLRRFDQPGGSFGRADVLEYEHLKAREAELLAALGPIPS